VGKKLGWWYGTVRYSAVFVVVVRYLLSRFLLVRYSICNRRQVLIGSSIVLATGLSCRYIGTRSY
jgi:hypothetical protein